MRKSKPSPIGEIVQSVFARIEKEKAFSKEGVDSLWKDLVGEAAFRHSRPATLRNKVLTVRVDSSAWMHELSIQKRKILKDLKREFGKDKLLDVHFRIGEF